MVAEHVRWNHNIHYQPLLLDAVPAKAKTALEVGTGDGMLSRRLRQRVPDVTAIDIDEPMVTLASNHPDAAGITYVHGDFLTCRLDHDAFDFVGSIATLHHMDPRAALQRMRDLVRPGGTLAILGLFEQDLPRDIPWELAGAATTRFLKLSPKRTYWETPAPKIWPPPHSLRQIRQVVQEELPDAAFRRLVLWRYFVTWQKPTA